MAQLLWIRHTARRFLNQVWLTCVHHLVEYVGTSSNREAVMCVDEEERAIDRQGGVSHIGDVLEELLEQYPVQLPEAELQAVEEPLAV
jgi:hypothetical protein